MSPLGPVPLVISFFRRDDHSGRLPGGVSDPSGYRKLVVEVKVR